MGKAIFAFGLILLFFGGLLALVGTHYGPGLVTDYRAQNQRLVTDHSLRVERWRCTARTMIVSMCTVYYGSASAPAATRGRNTPYVSAEQEQLNYLMLGYARPNKVVLLHPAGDRNAVVSSFGIENFGSRLAAFALFAGGLLAFVAYLIVKAIRSDKAGWQPAGAVN